MKKSAWLLGVLVLLSPLRPQVDQHEVTVINVAVPIRVFDGGTFVDTLSREDFEVFEDGKQQDIQALYLVHKSDIARREESRNFMPLVQRRFYLLFQLTDYNPQLNDAIDYFFQKVIQPGDTLEVMTPVKNYSLPPQTLQSKPREQLAKELINLVRKDTQIGSSAYREQIKELRRLVSNLSGSSAMTGFDTQQEDSGTAGSVEFLLPRYRETLEKLEELRLVDEKKFFRFAALLRRLEGQKNVFFFYQREFRPELHPRIISTMMSAYQDQPHVIGNLQDLMQFYYRNPSMNIERLKQAFADSSLFFNFIYMHKEPEHISGIQMTEQSEDVFKTFSEVAKATGGITDSSQNPLFSFQKGAEVSENYYLLYYSPLDYRKTGEFKTIVVKLKDKDYTVIHRLGYFAQ